MSRKSLKSQVADNIREYRLKKKLTQEKAAELSGFHYKYYQKIESGSVNLTLDSLEKLADMFGIRAEILLKK